MRHWRAACRKAAGSCSPQEIRGLTAHGSPETSHEWPREVYLATYVRGQLSDLARKSVEPMALQAAVPPRSLQEFLTPLQWDEQGMRDRMQKIVAAEHTAGVTIGLIDETSFVKKGTKTPGVQRQWCGHLGKIENCVVTVHLGVACGDFHAMLDGDLFLPESWDADRARCRRAGIPDEVVYRPQWKIALEQYDRAVKSGLRFDWMTFDEGYGGKPESLVETRGGASCTSPTTSVCRVASSGMSTRSTCSDGSSASSMPGTPWGSGPTP